MLSDLGSTGPPGSELGLLIIVGLVIMSALMVAGVVVGRHRR